MSNDTPVLASEKDTLVPKGLVIFLAAFTVVLCVLSSVLFGLVHQQPWLILAVKTTLLYAIGVPSLVCLGKLLLERLHKGLAFYWRNTLALGWLVSLSVIIWQMSTYT